MTKADPILKYKKAYQKNTNEKLIAEAQNSDLFAYIKVLLKAYKNIPNIIAILDKIIEKRATSVIPTASIYGGKFSTYGEIDHVIDLTARKDKLLNLYVLTGEMLSCLESEDKRLLTLKYVKKLSTQDIAASLKVTERTVFRRESSILNKLAICLLKKNWTSMFLQSQIGDEPWLNELYQKVKADELTNQARSEKVSRYNRSSSSITS